MANTNITALITGGTNGIRIETAFHFSRNGINVTIVGQTNDPIYKVFTSLGAKLFAKKTENGVEPSIYLVIFTRNGQRFFYFNNSVAIKLSHLSYDKTIASRLWKTSLKMIAKQTLSGGLK